MRVVSLRVFQSCKIVKRILEDYNIEYKGLWFYDGNGV